MTKTQNNPDAEVESSPADLVSREEAAKVAERHDKTHNSGYRCYEGAAIAEKLHALPTVAHSPACIAAGIDDPLALCVNALKEVRRIVGAREIGATIAVDLEKRLPSGNR